MGRKRVNWAMGVFAPWCLAVTLLVSFTADAEQELSTGASSIARADAAAFAPRDLVAATGLALSEALLVGRDEVGFRVPDSGSIAGDAQEASLVVGDPSDLSDVPDEITPRADLKPGIAGHAKVFPQPDRTNKSDPFIPLRPSFSTKLMAPSDVPAAQREATIFSDDDLLAYDGFDPDDRATPGPDSVASFDPYTDGALPTTAPAVADASPGDDDGGTTVPTNAYLRVLAGATPAVPRAVALSSTTPAAASAAPIEIAAFATEPPSDGALADEGDPDVTIVPKNPDQPDYAALVGQDQQAREEHCLAQAVYFEARSEPESGQAAVAQVVLNRVASGLYPSTICDVVFQNHTWHDACQFSFTCDGHSLRVSEPEAWRTAERVAHDVLTGTTYVAAIGDATHYHANYVRPRWARYLKKTDQIGHHIFYELRPGQT